MDSNCKKAKELISGAIDSELSAEESSYFDQHIESCEICRNEFELEKLTQIYFKDRVGLLDPPDDLLGLIRARLSEEDSMPVSGEQSIRVTFHKYLWQALGIAAVLVLVIVSLFTGRPGKVTSDLSQQPPATTILQTQDVLKSSEQDFQNILKGEFNPQVKADNAGRVLEFIKQNAGYSIPLPVIHGTDWIGGGVATMETEKVVSVVYKIGTSYLYIFAFPTLLAHSKAVSLSHECIKALDENQWFWKKSPKGNLQVAWKYQNHVCIATSNLGKGELIAYLKTIKEISDEGWR